MLDFKSAKQFLKNVINADAESEQFRSIVNQAVEALLNRGDWRATIQPVFLSTRSACLTLPRCVHSIRKLNIAGREVPINNVWYQFVDRQFYEGFLGQPYWNVVRPLGVNLFERNLNAVGYFPTFNDVPSPSYLQVYCDSQLDNEKTITIYGYDQNNQWIRTQTPLGIRDGCILTLTFPYVQTPMMFREGSLSRIVKDETQGNVRLFAFDPTCSGTSALGVYEPTETNPGYQRYNLHRFRGPNFCYDHGAMALVKVNYIPVRHDHDLILIDNAQALKTMCQSIQYGDASDTTNKAKYETLAIHELNLELRNEQPDWQIAINLNPFGSSPPRRSGVGRII